ncbi:hypothetical protein EXIGLDRAFT_762156 [Exidia glandulosa HHB12029]|uniref:Uncharacterized protein n=1 Tax=Exidia glandulosa HHB12029 TaxID=1314781 RepID=A0A165N135_EXIGL|nr:hypothetical protein EXIGLDRAFT_762156 [Exidia glandulosa HHB12029]
MRDASAILREAEERAAANARSAYRDGMERARADMEVEMQAMRAQLEKLRPNSRVDVPALMRESSQLAAENDFLQAEINHLRSALATAQWDKDCLQYEVRHGKERDWTYPEQTAYIKQAIDGLIARPLCRIANESDSGEDDESVDEFGYPKSLGDGFRVNSAPKPVEGEAATAVEARPNAYGEVPVEIPGPNDYLEVPGEGANSPTPSQRPSPLSPPRDRSVPLSPPPLEPHSSPQSTFQADRLGFDDAEPLHDYDDQPPPFDHPSSSTSRPPHDHYRQWAVDGSAYLNEGTGEDQSVATEAEASDENMYAKDEKETLDKLSAFVESGELNELAGIRDMTGWSLTKLAAALPSYKVDYTRPVSVLAYDVFAHQREHGLPLPKGRYNQVFCKGWAWEDFDPRRLWVDRPSGPKVNRDSQFFGDLAREAAQLPFVFRSLSQRLVASMGIAHKHLPVEGYGKEPDIVTQCRCNPDRVPPEIRRRYTVDKSTKQIFLEWSAWDIDCHIFLSASRPAGTTSKSRAKRTDADFKPTKPWPLMVWEAMKYVREFPYLIEHDTDEGYKYPKPYQGDGHPLDVFRHLRKCGVHPRRMLYEQGDFFDYVWRRNDAHDEMQKLLGQLDAALAKEDKSVSQDLKRAWVASRMQYEDVSEGEPVMRVKMVWAKLGRIWCDGDGNIIYTAKPPADDNLPRIEGAPVVNNVSSVEPPVERPAGEHASVSI